MRKAAYRRKQRCHETRAREPNCDSTTFVIRQGGHHAGHTTDGDHQIPPDTGKRALAKSCGIAAPRRWRSDAGQGKVGPSRGEGSR